MYAIVLVDSYNTISASGPYVSIDEAKEIMKQTAESRTDLLQIDVVELENL